MIRLHCTLSALSPAGRECICQSEISISGVDLLNDVAHSPHLSLQIKYQTLCQNMSLFHQITSLISAMPSKLFGLLCFKSGNIEQGTQET